jgi:hypothetical protein
VIQEPEVNVLVVEDHALGTNDCRGWISERLFRKLNLPDHRFYQFRLAFERTQAKGSFKVMHDDVADLLRADIILPESSIKPKLELGFLDGCQKWLAGLESGIQGVRFRSSIVLGNGTAAISISTWLPSFKTLNSRASSKVVLK